MQRRILAAVLAVILTVVGAVLIAAYVQSADQRAMATLAPVSVLVVNKPIPKGTAAEALGDAVAVYQMPRNAVPVDAVADVAALAGRVASVDLVPGEQVLATRFVLPNQLSFDTVAIPKGLQEVSITLEAVRVVGGLVRPGDTVGMVVSVKEPKIGSQFMLNNVLVTRVQGATAVQPSATPGAQEVAPAAIQTVMITVALSAANAERVVYAMEHSYPIWLTLQNKDTTAGSTLITNENLLP